LLACDCRGGAISEMEFGLGCDDVHGAPFLDVEAVDRGVSDFDLPNIYGSPPETAEEDFGRDLVYTPLLSTEI